MIRYGLHRLRADLVRAMHARGSGEAARRAKRGRQPLPSRAISHAWPFACFAFCSMDYRKKERLLVVYGLQKTVSKHLKMLTCCSALIPQRTKSFSE